MPILGGNDKPKKTSPIINPDFSNTGLSPLISDNPSPKSDVALPPNSRTFSLIESFNSFDLFFDLIKHDIKPLKFVEPVEEDYNKVVIAITTYRY